MGTHTPNLNLFKPDASDPFGEFREKFNDNMDILDNGGGGGGGGHTIVNENGATMPTESKLQFTGAVNVTDDSVNGKTVVDIAGGGEYFYPVIYSDVERKIGVWRDNKPLYAKTVHISALPSSATMQAYPHNIANIDRICHYEGVGVASSGSTVTLNRVGMGGSTLNGATSYDLYVNKTNINISVGQDRSGIEADVTIWYTKTTDTAGSGDYNTYGVPTVHYSTSEQVIGTYLGKPLYQITYSGLSLVCTNANQSYATNINWGNIEKIVHSDIIDQYGQSCAGSVVYTGTPAKIAVYMQMANRTVTDITIKYTKTTD